MQFYLLLNQFCFKYLKNKGTRLNTTTGLGYSFEIVIFTYINYDPMKLYLYFFLAAILSITSLASAQIVNIPDPIFKAYLVGEPLINTNADSEIQVAEATAYTGDIDITYAGITDFTGLQAFTAVLEVYINDNLHPSLDLTGMTALERIITDDSDSLQTITFGSNPNLYIINISYCNISSLDVTMLPALTDLYMGGNPVTSIDLSNNPNLAVLGATGCDLASLDLSNNLFLQELYTVFNTDITSLDLSMHSQLSFLNVMNCNLNYLNVANGNNTTMNSLEFRCGGNDDLFSVCVDDTAYSNNYWNDPWYVDTFTVFTDTCPPSPGLGIVNVNHHAIRIMNNPTRDFVYLSQPCSFKLFSSSGSVIGRTTYSSHVDMRELNPGIYILVIEGEKGLPPVTFKLLKE
jgi:hypothetical protein